MTHGRGIDREVIIVKDLNEIAFHDANVLGLEIKTINDHFDCILITLESSEFMNSYRTSTIKLVFRDCFKAQFNLQMWIVGKDSVRSFDLIKDSNWIPEVEKLNKDGYGPKASDLKHFHLNLNTSNSSIDILAKEVDIKPITDFS